MQSFLFKLRFLLSRRDKEFLLALFALSVVVALIETVGISAIMPFITVATNPNLTEQNIYYKAVYDFFNFSSAQQFIIVFGMLLIVFYVLRGAINILHAWLLARFSQGRYHIIAYKLFCAYLALSYQDFTKRNSSKLTKTIITETSLLVSLISAALNLVSEISVVIILYGLLLWVNWKVTTVLTVILAVQVLLLLKIVSRKIAKEGERRNIKQNALYETINSSLGNFKLIKLLGNEKSLFEVFGEASIGYAKSNIVNITLQSVPRVFLETLGFGVLIALVVYVVYQYNDASFVIPIVSMFALALYRLLPSAQRIMGNFNLIQFSLQSLHTVYDDLALQIEKEGDQPVTFDHSLALNHIHFAFSADKPIINGVSLQIIKGEKVGFIGESGSGKSTIIDLICGIYKPKSGDILVDNVPITLQNVKNWRRKIGYIPQEIYLFDGTVGENVAFGGEWDETRLIAALKAANIYDFLQTHEGLSTRVGEGGVLLSGGQKQRIGIARALYGDPEILALDEATSALDSETEAKIMDEIYSAARGKTMIVIAHRLSTLERCDKIYKVSAGKITQQINAV